MIGTGLPASPGAAVGQIVFTAEDAEAWHAQGKAVILVIYFYCCIRLKQRLTFFNLELVYRSFNCTIK